MDNNIIEPRTLLYDQKKSKAFFKNIEEFTFKKKDLLYQLQSSFRCSNETIEEIRLEMNSTVFLENHWEQIRNQECIFMQELNKYNVTICDILQDLKTPSINDCRLVPNSLFKNEEMDIFKLNGLDSLLISKSCPWNRFLDIGYGIISIIVGLTMIRSFNLKGFAHLITGAAELISGVLHTTKWGHYLQNNIMVNAIRHHYNKVTNNYFGISINPTNDHKKIERVFKHINSSKNTSTRIEVFLKSVNELLIKSLIEHGDSAMLCMNKLQNYINDELKNVKTGAVLKKILHEVFKQLKLETKRSIKYDSYATNIQQYAKNIHISKEHIEEFWSCLYDTCSNTYVLEEYVFEPIEIEEQQNIIKIYLEKHFVEPFIFGGRRVIENLFLKCDLELYESLNDKSDKKEYESLKLKLYEDYHATEVLKEHRSVYIEDIINKSYLSILSNNKLMNKIRKFYLLADLIEDNIMLPEVYLDVMTHILPKILGFDFLTIHVDDTNIMRAYNTPNATTKSHLTITISLVNGKFQLYDNGHINDFKQLLNYPNNLYEAIDGTHDCILSKEKFAEVISTHIREDVQIQKVIKEIWMKIDGNGESDTPKIRRTDVLGEFNYEIEDVSENLNSIVAYKIRNAREESAVYRSEKTLPIPINETNTCNGNLNSLMADGTSDASRNSANNKTEMIPPIPVNESNSQNDNLNTFLADSTQVTDRISADDNKAEKISPMADGTSDASRNSTNNKTEMIPPIPVNESNTQNDNLNTFLADNTQATDRISADDNKAEKISPIPINKTNTRNGNFNSSLKGRTQDASRNSADNKANNIPRPINKTDTTREFNKKQELELKEVLQKFANLFYGLSDEDSRTIIYETAKLNNFPLHFNEDRMVCQTWFEDFKKRHQLNLNINLSPKHKITLFLNQLDELMKKLSLSDGSRIFCLDETCFSGYDKDTDSDKSFTACCIVSANGKAFLPILIMPKVKFSKNILPRECWRSQSDGLPNSDIFPYIIQYFIKNSCSSKQNPTILILDKHHSHMSVKALNIAEKAGVHTLPLDFDISNKLLPFKMGIFESFQTVCKERIKKLSALNKKTSWPVNDVLKFVVPLLRSKISNSECIIKAFKTCGIYPLDKKIFEDNADI
uniref:DDE-1 domain-containing protein n=1 Tax=Xenopsylla cheopis TaxID=163159 RepID=A0A6M2DT33_XENCH